MDMKVIIREYIKKNEVIYIDIVLGVKFSVIVTIPNENLYITLK